MPIKIHSLLSLASPRLIGAVLAIALGGPGHEKIDIDPVTLQPLEGGERLRTAHVQRTLRRILGIDGHPLAQTYALDVPEIDLLNPAYSSPVQV